MKHLFTIQGQNGLELDDTESLVRAFSVRATGTVYSQWFRPLEDPAELVALLSLTWQSGPAFGEVTK